MPRAYVYMKALYFLKPKPRTLNPPQSPQPVGVPMVVVVHVIMASVFLGSGSFGLGELGPFLLGLW